jgi:predicted ABC-type ATPase
MRIRRLIAMKRSFTWETTMSGRTAAVWIKSAKASGYRIKCYFLWVRNVESTLNRIRQRVHEGGHNIDADVSRRRFLKTIQNFFSVYRPLCDSWELIVTDRKSPRMLALEKNGRLVTRDKNAVQGILHEAGII